MHRVVIYVNPVTSNGQTLYGRLYAGETESDILLNAFADYKTLTVREEWEGEQGEEFREREGWTLVHSTDGSRAWWRFEETKYTYHKGYNPIPDQFVDSMCNSFAQHIALIDRWVPLKIADCNNEDYITNGAFYDMIANSNDIQWTDVDETEADDCPF